MQYTVGMSFKRKKMTERTKKKIVTVKESDKFLLSSFQIKSRIELMKIELMSKMKFSVKYLNKSVNPASHFNSCSNLIKALTTFY